MTERQSRQKRKVGIESFPRSHNSNSSTHTFLFHWNKTEHKKGCARMKRQQQLRPNQPYISPPSHNSPTMASLSFLSLSSSRRGNTHLALGALHPPPPITLIHFLLSLLLIDTKFLQRRSKSQELPQLKRTRHSQPIRLLSQRQPGR